MPSPQKPGRTRLTGLNPLAYMGVEPVAPAGFLWSNRAPTVNDVGFDLGQAWLNTTDQSLWILTSLEGYTATWSEFIGGGVTDLRADDANIATPFGGVVNVFGGNNISTTAPVISPHTLVVNVSGTTNNAIQIGNPTASLTSLPVGTDGQIPIGSTNSAPVMTTITAGANITITNAPGSITIASTGGGGSGTVKTLTGNDGTPIDPDGSGNINIVTNGTNIQFIGSGSTETLDFHATSNIIIGSLGAFISGASDNTCIGAFSGTAISGAMANTSVGSESFLALNNGQQSCAFGYGSLNQNQGGLGNTALGTLSMAQLNGSGNAYNTAVGWSSMFGITGAATHNTVIGYQAGFNYTTTESNNALFSSQGVLGDNNVMRLGTTGSGASQQSKCFLGATSGVNVGSVAKVITMAAATEQIGTATITAGTGITVTPTANTITIAATGTSQFNYTAVSTTPYVVLTTDDYIGVNASGGARTVQLPNAPATGRVWIIKDSLGFAATNNVTVTTVGGSVNIDGATTFVMNTAYESVQVIFNGSSYEVF